MLKYLSFNIYFSTSIRTRIPSYSLMRIMFKSVFVTFLQLLNLRQLLELISVISLLTLKDLENPKLKEYKIF